MASLSALQSRNLAFRIFRYALLAFLIAWPWWGNTFVYLGDANVALEYVIVAASLVLLTGWVGQISLAQASFVGVGAFATAIVARDFHLGFPLSLIVGGAASAGAACLLGLVALRVRGLYLAVATLIVAWMCDTYLFLSPWLAGGGGAVSVRQIEVGTRGAFPYFDFANRRTFYYVALAVAALVVFALSNLRDSKTGRAFFAVKGSEIAAASMGVDVVRYKLLAFGVSGFVAGLAGNLIAVNQGSLTPASFKFTVSFFFLAIPVVGGLQSLTGAVAASVVFGALNDIFFRFPALNGYLEIVSAGLLMAVLLLYPAGLAGLPGAFGRWFDRLQRRLADQAQAEAEHRTAGPFARVLSGETGAESALARTTRRVVVTLDRWTTAPSRLARRASVSRVTGPTELLPMAALGLEALAPPEANGHAFTSLPDEVNDGPRRLVLEPHGDVVHPRPTGDRLERRLVLGASHITVRFGGLTAVNDVSLQVRQGEIVGLIGPNGAGKTTLFNAIAGLNSPTSGAVSIFGVDATHLPVHARAKLGVGRTFQAIQLITELSVFDNLLIATHLQNPTGFLSHISVTAGALVAEERSRILVLRVLEMLGLTEVAHRPAAGLPFGTLRMIEVARALVTRSPLIMLDEPASGLDNAETDRLSELLFYLREQLGVTILLIEHDVAMVTKVCDHMYVIDRGNLIAEGPTSVVQRDPKVIAAYLGEAPSDDTEPETALVVTRARAPARRAKAKVS